MRPGCARTSCCLCGGIVVALKCALSLTFASNEFLERVCAIPAPFNASRQCCGANGLVFVLVERRVLSVLGRRDVRNAYCSATGTLGKKDKRRISHPFPAGYCECVGGYMHLNTWAMVLE